jgi:hypothetical protein
VSLLTLVRDAVVERWLAYEPLVDALGGPHVFNRYPPEDFELPPLPNKRITVGERTQIPVPMMGSGSSVTLMTQARTDGFYGDSQVEELAELMDEALEEPLVIVGYGGVVLRNELTAVMVDPDDVLIRLATNRYRISALKVPVTVPEMNIWQRQGEEWVQVSQMYVRGAEGYTPADAVYQRRGEEWVLIL